MMCMRRTNLVDAFLLRRERVFRSQWQRWLKYCLSCTSANQSAPDGVLLNKTCDNNGQRARVRDREEMRGARGTWSHKRHRDRVAEAGVQNALHEQEG
jgi:hypothetical protein